MRNLNPPKSPNEERLDAKNRYRELALRIVTRFADAFFRFLLMFLFLGLCTWLAFMAYAGVHLALKYW